MLTAADVLDGQRVSPSRSVSSPSAHPDLRHDADDRLRPADDLLRRGDVDGGARLRAQLDARHTGQTPEQIHDDSDRDRYMTPEESVADGLVDRIVEPKRVAIRS